MSEQIDDLQTQEPAPENEKPRKKWWQRVLKIAVIVLLIVLALLLVAAVTVFVLYKIGESSMLNYDNVTVVFPQPETAVTQPTSEGEEVQETTEYILTYDDGKTVFYQGKTYELNENVATFLFIGIDRDDIEENELYGDGGEADCILLVGVDTRTGETDIINISRDSYAQVDIYSAGGKYLESRGTQLCRAFAYGDGQEASCENVMKSVSRLLYGLPIRSYIAVDMTAIGEASRAVGGITLTSIGNVKYPPFLTCYDGQEITLYGTDAECYVRYRDKTKVDGNVERMARQKQFVQLFVSKLLKETKNDLTTLVDMYSAMEDYTFTGMSIADVTFLLTCFLQNGANFDFTTLNGTADMLGSNAIYYLDQTSLYEAVLDVYYTQVDAT